MQGVTVERCSLGHVSRLVHVINTELRVLVVCNATHHAPWLSRGDILQPHFLQDFQALLAVLRHTLACYQLLTHAVHRFHVVSLERPR